jgi:NADPH-dependent curcumin reductase CurA
MSTPRHIENVALDDEDLGKRNEALIIENEVLSEQVLESQLQMFAMAQRVNAMHGVQEMGIVEPEDVRKVCVTLTPLK